MNVYVYTGHDQAEQPLVIYAVHALVVSAGNLTIEADQVETSGHGFHAMHRFESGKWSHFEVHHNGGPT